MSYRVLLCLVDPGVKGRDVDVLDLLSGLNCVMKFDSVGASTEEGEESGSTISNALRNC